MPVFPSIISGGALFIGPAADGNANDVFATDGAGNVVLNTGGGLSASDIDTLAELNAILTDATLDDASSVRPPAGSDTQIQFNDGGVLAGDANLTWTGSQLKVTGTVTTTVTSIIEGAASQSVDMTQWNPNGVTAGTRTRIGSNGGLHCNPSASGSRNTYLATTVFPSALTGDDNICIGERAGEAITSGSRNFAIGWKALKLITTSDDNMAIGPQAGENSSGFRGTFIGNLSGSNCTANDIVCIGYQAGATAALGNGSVHIGYQSARLSTGVHNIAIGRLAADTVTSGSSNVVIGGTANLGSTTSSCIVIGRDGTSTFDACIIFGRSVASTAANQFVAGSSSYPVNDIYFGKGVSNATPTVFTIHGTSGSGTDIAGGPIAITGGDGSATNANGGNVRLYGGAKAGSGTDGNVVLAHTGSAARGRVVVKGNTSINTWTSLHINSTDSQDGITIKATTFPTLQFDKGSTAIAIVGVAGNAGGFIAGSVANSLVITTQSGAGSNHIHFATKGVLGATLREDRLALSSTTTEPIANLHFDRNNNSFYHFLFGQTSGAGRQYAAYIDNTTLNFHFEDVTARGAGALGSASRLTITTTGLTGIALGSTLPTAQLQVKAKDTTTPGLIVDTPASFDSTTPIISIRDNTTPRIELYNKRVFIGDKASDASATSHSQGPNEHLKIIGDNPWFELFDIGGTSNYKRFVIEKNDDITYFRTYRDGGLGYTAQATFDVDMKLTVPAISTASLGLTGGANVATSGWFGFNSNANIQFNVSSTQRILTPGNDRITMVTTTSTFTMMSVGRTTACCQLFPAVATTKGLVIKGFTAQTASLTDWTDSSNTVLLSVDATGVILGNAASLPTSMTAGLSFKNGTAPASSPVDQFSMYADDQAAGNSCPHFRTELGNVIKLFKGAALTAADATALDGTIGTNDTVTDNIRTRLNQLESRLQAHGLVT